MLKKLILVITILLIFLCSSQIHAEDAKPFYMGVYLYDYQVAKAAKSLGKDYFGFLEKHLKILKANGVNVIHLVVTKPKLFDDHLRLAEKYDMKLLPQLDFAYFFPANSQKELDNKAKRAGVFIKKYLNNPNVLAWSIKEEIDQKDVNHLGEYYEQILQHVPDAKFFIIHYQLDAAKDQPPPNPVISGTDRYAFWWTISASGYLASPAFALDWTRTQAAAYYKESAKRGADFMLVITQGGMIKPKWANNLAKNPKDLRHPKTLNERMAMQKKILKFAKDGRMGWRKFPTPQGDFYNVWKYYRAPKNCMKAMAWISVLEGAKLFLCWHYAPYGNPDKLLNFEGTVRSGKSTIDFITLAGRPQMDNPQLKEFGEAAREIRSYESIITQMSKVSDCPINVRNKHVHCNAFNFPGLRGKIVVIQNSNVGTWPANSRYRFKDEDPIRIDDAGNLVDYKPFTEPLDVHFSLVNTKLTKDSDQRVYDLKTGKEIPADDGYKTSVMPGSGVLLYVGSAQDAEKLSKMVK